MGPLSNPLSLGVCFSCTRINEERTADGKEFSLSMRLFLMNTNKLNEERTDLTYVPFPVILIICVHSPDDAVHAVNKPWILL